MTDTSTKRRRVAMAGLGLMGTPIATRLQAAGHDLAVWNRSGGRGDELVAAGARRAASPAEAAKGAEVVFVMVTDDAAVKAVVGGVLEGAAPGTVIVDMSTVLPDTSRAMAAAAGAKGVVYLDCPVSGSTDAAAKGALVVFAGGDGAALDGVRDLLAVIAGAVNAMGPSGSGTATKLAVNGLLGMGLQAVAEAVSLGQALGLERARLIDALASTAVVSATQKRRLESARAGNYAPGFTLANMVKDFGLIEQAAAAAGVALPALSASAASARAAPADAMGSDAGVIIPTVEKRR
jgi:3-hydroxyisobutyrate dehydrogenase-like beta-hydroxyacid dehydrogenase